MDKSIITKNNNMQFIKISAIILFSIVIIYVILWIYKKLHLNNTNCNNIKKLYKDFPLIKTINPNNKDDFSHNLRDYYIKTAYNCCSAGNYKNDFVNICALKECIKQGARCLDFQIFSLNDEPVIATSTLNDFTIKETYNSIPFADAIEIIQDYAYSGSTCPNPGDPLIIHLHIMSKNKKIYDKMANILYNKLETKLLGKKYSYENNGKNLGMMPLKNLMGKIVLVIDKTNAIFENTLLDEYVNIASNSIFMRFLRFHDVKYTTDMQELIEFNKKNMTICLPDSKITTNNPSSSLSMKYGCQMVGMSFQNFDSNMEFYDELFDNAGSAFVLKPEHLRHIPVYIDLPKPPTDATSYKQRPVTSDYYSFTI